jgi:hypothetical protein
VNPDNEADRQDRAGGEMARFGVALVAGVTGTTVVGLRWQAGAAVVLSALWLATGVATGWLSARRRARGSGGEHILRVGAAPAIIAVLPAGLLLLAAGDQRAAVNLAVIWLSLVAMIVAGWNLGRRLAAVPSPDADALNSR